MRGRTHKVHRALGEVQGDFLQQGSVWRLPDTLATTQGQKATETGGEGPVHPCEGPQCCGVESEARA